MRIQWILVAALGLGLTACASSKSEEKEGPEIKMAIDQVPAAVKATVNREAEGATVTSVDQSTDDGKNIYEADAMIQGKNYEIIVAEDGSLISKKLDDEAAEKKATTQKSDAKDKD